MSNATIEVINIDLYQRYKSPNGRLLVINYMVTTDGKITHYGVLDVHNETCKEVPIHVFVEQIKIGTIKRLNKE